MNIVLDKEKIVEICETNTPVILEVFSKFINQLPLESQKAATKIVHESIKCSLLVGLNYTSDKQLKDAIEVLKQCYES